MDQVFSPSIYGTGHESTGKKQESVTYSTDQEDEALYVIRYHSFFPWHCSGDYNYLCNDKDMKMLEWVKEFNKFDLYSKSDTVPDVEAVSPYYEELIAKYCPGELCW